MHCHQSLFQNGKNAFSDPAGPYEMAKAGLYYIGGLLRHARDFCAITNPLVNSYKRLVPGYEAPTDICWSERNRSPLARVPARKGEGSRVEMRNPDPSCNPYLAFAVMLKAGLAGIKGSLDPGPPINANIYEMSEAEKLDLKIDSLPVDLNEAIGCMEASELVKETLGAHSFNHYILAKREVWRNYIAQVHQWELDRYLSSY
jgi:glutamine synthetase